MKKNNTKNTNRSKLLEKANTLIPEKIILQSTDTTDYFKQVYEIVSQIPAGKVTTYGNIARALGNISKSRAVGYALNAVVNSDIPCHRVVNRNGELTGSIHFPTPTLMRELLESENIEFTNGAVNLKKHLWVPAT